MTVLQLRGYVRAVRMRNHRSRGREVSRKNLARRGPIGFPFPRAEAGASTGSLTVSRCLSSTATILHGYVLYISGGLEWQFRAESRYRLMNTSWTARWLFGSRSFRIEKNGNVDATMDTRNTRVTIEWWFPDGEGRTSQSDWRLGFVAQYIQVGSIFCTTWCR